jgi:hypothetical protein
LKASSRKRWWLIPYSFAENCTATITVTDEDGASGVLHRMGAAVEDVSVDVSALVSFNVADEGRSDSESGAELEVLGGGIVESSCTELASKNRLGDILM